MGAKNSNEILKISNFIKANVRAWLLKTYDPT